jgi:hypothetical protein
VPGRLEETSMSGGGGRKKLILVALVVVVAAIAGGSLAIFGPWGTGAGVPAEANAGPSAAPVTPGAAAPAPATTGEQPPADDSELAGRSDDYGGTGPTTVPTPGTTPGSAPRAAGTLISVSGSLSGLVTAISGVSCTREPGGSFSWRLTGTVDGGPLTITFNTNAYRGSGVYRTTGVTDTGGGYMNLEHGEGGNRATVGSNGATNGTFTIEAGERSGQIATTLTDTAAGLEVRVTGPWRCTG